MSLLESTANFIGKDGFNWWIGQVEARWWKGHRGG